MAKPAAMMPWFSTPRVSRGVEKRSGLASITPDDGTRIGSACAHEEIHEQSSRIAGVCDVRTSGTAVACSCGARIRRSCTDRAKSPVRVAPGIQDLVGTLDGATPQYGSGAQRLASPSSNAHSLARTRPLWARRRDRNNSESILLSPRPTTMLPGCGTSRVLPLALLCVRPSLARK